jgi:hypothetical protein
MKIDSLKKMLSSSVVGTLLLVGASAPLAAKNSSLVGIEGGYNSIASEVTTATTYTQSKTGMGHTGLKIGAESDDFRIFLAGRYYFADKEYDSLVTYGVDVQYKFNISQYFNAFIGANAGLANAKFKRTGENFSRTISDPYFGGDLGFNVHLGDRIDLELGGRYMTLDATNTKNDVKYTFNDIISGYASIIFKWQMD